MSCRAAKMERIMKMRESPRRVAARRKNDVMQKDISII